MVPGAQPEAMVLFEGALPNVEIMQRIKEVMEAMRDMMGVILDFVYLVLGLPVMRLDTCFSEFVSFSFFCPSP
jgi:cadmium resistance protein CadD (predicted permease)